MKYIIFLVLVFGMLAGCAQSTATKIPGNDGDVLITNGESDATVTEITLKDGTKCAVLIGSRKGAISCGWK